CQSLPYGDRRTFHHTFWHLWRTIRSDLGACVANRAADLKSGPRLQQWRHVARRIQREPRDRFQLRGLLLARGYEPRRHFRPHVRRTFRRLLPTAAAGTGGIVPEAIPDGAFP